MIRNLPDHWDMETDVLAVGSGAGGLAAAITAHDCGARAMVVERADQVGGVTALSMGEVWVPGNHHAKALGIEDSDESGFRYLQRLAMGYGEDVATANLVMNTRVALQYFEDRIGLKMRVIRDCPDYYYGVSNDAVSEGRLLECLPFPAATLGEWQDKTRISPMTPYSMTHEDMYEKGGGTSNIAGWDYSVMAERLTKDERCLGSGLAAYFVKGALDRGIPMHVGVNVEELIGDGERVIGVRATRDGETLFIKANKGVVLAVSSYERNPQLARTLDQLLDIQSMLFPSIDGANFRLAGPFGARLAKVPDITSLGYHIPGEEQAFGGPLWRNSMTVTGLPHTIVVNRSGKRFGNESFYRDLLFKVDAIEGSTQTHPNYPCWAIFDSQAREKYPFGTVMPGQPLPEGFGATAQTLAELAGKIGVPADVLEATVAGFNIHAAKGQDPEFNRGVHPWSAWICGDKKNKPHPNLGPLTKGPFYAVELNRIGGSAIPSAGIVADHHSRAIGWDNAPVAGLYVAGNSVARMESGAMMQSGVSNARGMTYGHLAGRHAAGDPSTLLETQLPRLSKAAA